MGVPPCWKQSYHVFGERKPACFIAPQQYGEEESWTTIKAHDYKKARELLEGRKAKKSRLMEAPEAERNGPSEGQLAEAAVLCDLMAVPPEYLQGVLTEIYQVTDHQMGRE